MPLMLADVDSNLHHLYLKLTNYYEAYDYLYYITNRWGPKKEKAKVLVFQAFPKHKIMFELMHHSTMLYC
jgi:hypothetical protein